MNQKSSEPLLDIISQPKPPQRILLPPRAHKPASTSDIPKYRETMYPSNQEKIEEQVQNYVNSVLSAGINKSVPIVTGSKHVKTLHSGRISKGNWIDNLVGKSFYEAKPIINMHRISYRITQIDDIIMDFNGSKNVKELYIVLVTNENHQSTDNKKTDQLKVSSWFSEHMNESVIKSAILR